MDAERVVGVELEVGIVRDLIDNAISTAAVMAPTWITWHDATQTFQSSIVREVAVDDQIRGIPERWPTYGVDLRCSHAHFHRDFRVRLFRDDVDQLGNAVKIRLPLEDVDQFGRTIFVVLRAIKRPVRTEVCGSVVAEGVASGCQVERNFRDRNIRGPHAHDGGEVETVPDETVIASRIRT